MALAKYHEDIVEARCENGAAIIFDYQHPQASTERTARAEIGPDQTPCKLTFIERFLVKRFVYKLRKSQERITPELLERTSNWTLPQFEELGRIAPEVLAQVAMVLRDQTVAASTPERHSYSDRRAA